jgi:hypothetical protein
LAQRLRTVAEQRGLPHLDGRAPAGPFAVPLWPFIQVLMGAIRDAASPEPAFLQHLAERSCCPWEAGWTSRATAALGGLVDAGAGASRSAPSSRETSRASAR